ncbi:MAG: carboxypeptidase-like regulatory domain-containing protein, partial [Bacteroidota bacterium]
MASFANTIKGTVTDNRSSPLPGVTIQIQGTSIGAISDVKGNYVIIDVPAGDHTLLVSSIGFKRIVKNISIKDNQTKKYDFSLEESAEELAEVVVRGQSESEIKKAAPIQIESIRLSTVVEQIKDLNDALITMPGVRIQSSGSLGDRSEISLNGLTGQAVRSYVDGLPFEFLYPTLTITNIPLNTVERIDIYKGVVPVDIGTDALAGAVNVVTNRKISNAIEGFYSFGSFNTHQAGISGSYQLNEKLSFQVNTAYNYSDNDYKIKAPVLVEIDELNTERVEREVRRFNDAYELKFADVSLSLINTRAFDFAKITIGYSDYFKEVNNPLRITDSPWGEYEFSGEVVLTNLQLEKEFNDRLSLQSNTAYSFSSIQTVDTTRREYVWDGSFEIGSAGENGDNPTLANRKNNNLLNRTSLIFKFFEEDELLISNIAAYQDIFGRDELRSFESDLL